MCVARSEMLTSTIWDPLMDGREQVVKFKGSVHYAKGDFVGVELTEPLGKNDGTIKGVAYFACPPQFGLMVRPEDVSLVA